MKNLVYANDLQPTDWIKVGGMLCEILTAKRNQLGGVILHCYPVGATKRQKLTLIVPRRLPFKTIEK